MPEDPKTGRDAWYNRNLETLGYIGERFGRSDSTEIEKLANVDVERSRKAHERIDRYVKLSALDAGHICAFEASCEGQRLLGHLRAARRSNRTQASTDFLPN